jgi:hypothetical protein
MNKLTTTVALATLIASPVFETPADAVMVGLLATITVIGIATVVSFAVSSSSPDQQRLLSRRTCSPAALAHRPRMRRSLWSTWRWIRPSAATQFARRAA